MRKGFVVWVLTAALIASAARAADVETHFAPQEDLEAIDVATLDSAGQSIDMAAYVLSDGRVIEALRSAADRGVAIRLYMDRTEYEGHATLVAGLLSSPNVLARIKGRGVLMHLKAYAVDGRILRTGSGNFSRPGLADQDNDLVLLVDAAAVARFETNFESIWDRGANIEADAR